MADGQGSGHFTVVLPRCEASVEDGRAALMAYLEPLGLDARITNRIEVVLEELVSNVVRHANEAQSVTINADCSDDVVSLAIEDNGAPFNPLEMAERGPFTDLDDAPLGGLGLPLVKRLSRAVSYERVDGYNRVTAEIAAG